MKPITLHDRDLHHSGNPPRQQDDARASTRFRRLLETTQDNLNDWTPLPPMHFDLPATFDDDSSACGTTTRREIAGNVTLGVAPKIADNQVLALRTVTGPLAGLVVQARIDGNRLVIKLKTPSAELAKRMTDHRESLSKALDRTLGMGVLLEVEHDPAC